MYSFLQHTHVHLLSHLPSHLPHTPFMCTPPCAPPCVPRHSQDAQSAVVITADGVMRGKKLVDLHSIADKACAIAKGVVKTQVPSYIVV